MLRQSPKVEQCPNQWGPEQIHLARRPETLRRRYPKDLGMRDGEVVPRQELIQEQLRVNPPAGRGGRALFRRLHG
jgi:hypothetical protein